MGCPRQHHPRPTAARGTRGEPGRERLAVHPGHLAFDPRFQDLRRHRRSLLPSLEHPHASTMARHLNRRARMGPSGGSIEQWYYAKFYGNVPCGRPYRAAIPYDLPAAPFPVDRSTWTRASLANAPMPLRILPFGHRHKALEPGFGVFGQFC